MTPNLNLHAIMTLRYDPTRPTLVPRLKPKDFVPHRKGRPIEQRILQVLDRDMPHPKEISVLLSAGVDSRFTLEMFRRLRPETRITAVVIGFDDSTDENRQALELAYRHDISCTSIIMTSVLQDIQKLVSIVDEPRWNLYPYYAYQACQSKIVYVGDGSDETWAGYTWRYQKCGNVMTYLASHARDTVDDMEDLMPGCSLDRVAPLITNNFDNDLPYIDQCLMADFNGKLLYDYIPNGRTLAASLDKKIHSLFLLPSMVDLATHTPWQWKFDGNFGKLPIQNVICTRIAKKGFSPPLWKIWEREGRELYKYYVNKESDIVKDKVVNYDWIARHQEPPDKRHTASVRYINKMLMLVALEIWYRQRH